MAATEEHPFWEGAEWCSVLPPDNIIVGDVVIQRSLVTVPPSIDVKDTTSSSSSKLEEPLKSSQKLDDFMKRLEALENTCVKEDERLNITRKGVKNILKSVGLSNSIQTGPPIQGLLKGGFQGNLSLLCDCLQFIDMKSRSSLLVASKDIHNIFSGPQIVISSRYRPNNAPPIEIKSQNSNHFNKKNITFLTSKESVKVISLKKNEEVFFRPNLLCAKYDSDQDWPRGRVKEVRADGFVVIETWSWKLAGGKGATIYARWNDVRRAGVRTRFQMLPEQRVWKAQELKEEATVLFTAALKEEKAHIDWLASKKNTASSGPSLTKKDSVTSPNNKNNGAKVELAKSPSKKEKVPLVNSMFVLLNPLLSQSAEAVDFIRSKITDHSAVKIVVDGTISAKDIKQYEMVDAHYSGIAENAMKVSPKTIDLLPKQKELFEKEFNISWAKGLKLKQIKNIKEIQNEINEINLKNKEVNNDKEITFEFLMKESSKESNGLWLGKGLHITKVLLPVSHSSNKKNEERFVVNGFYPSLKSKYIQNENLNLNYFIIEFDSLPSSTSDPTSTSSWKSIEQNLLLPLGKDILDNRLETLNLLSYQDELQKDNNAGIYYSTSPFMALIDKMNWLQGNSNKNKFSLLKDKFAMSILGGNLNEKLITQTWNKNPFITFENEHGKLFDHIKYLDADVCSLKLKAMICDPYSKLEAAKQRYTEAVQFVDGDDIYDPDLDRRAKIQPCTAVLSSISDLKVSIFTNIALCCRKIIMSIDRMNSIDIINKKKQTSSPGSSLLTQVKNDTNGMKEIRGIHSRYLIDYAMRAVKIVDMLSLMGTHARPIVKELMKKHENAKFFGQMRCKALFLAATGYADTESPCIDNDMAMDVLRRAKNELNNHAPKKDKPDHVSPSLRKMLDAQKKEIDTLLRKCSDSRKKQQAAGKKRWSAAFEKNAKDPNAGLPPPKTSPSPSSVSGMEATEQAKLEAAFMNQGIKMPDGTVLGGAGLMGGQGPTPTAAMGGQPGAGLGQSANPFIQEMPPATSKASPPPPSSKSKPTNRSVSQVSQKKEEPEEEEDEDTLSLQENILGGVALAGVAAAVGFGVMWFKNRRR